MITPSPLELAQLVVKEFDRHSELSLDKMLTAVLRKLGEGRYKSEEIAFNVEDAVLRHLLSFEEESLPFRIRGKRLVGKERTGEIDDPDTVIAKMVHGLFPLLLDALVKLTPDEFEVACAASMLLSGACEMKALCTGDEGGIDFYGRIEVRQSSEGIPKGVIHTTILPRKLLILGQAKRYGLDTKVGREVIQQFHGQVVDCLKQYEGNTRPPSHRVPSSYYHRGELALGVFITTGSFTDAAVASAAGLGYEIIHGQKLAQFLCFKRVGIIEQGGNYVFDPQVFRAWLTNESQVVNATLPTLVAVNSRS
jgi:hypothetical protein